MGVQCWRRSLRSWYDRQDGEMQPKEEREPERRTGRSSKRRKGRMLRSMVVDEKMGW